jgi:hypothetical protein
LEVLDLDISEVETFLDLVELINDKHIWYSHKFYKQKPFWSGINS